MATSKLDVALAHGGHAIFHIESEPGHTLIHHHILHDDGTATDVVVRCTCTDANGDKHTTTKVCSYSGPPSPTCDCTDAKNPKITC